MGAIKSIDLYAGVVYYQMPFRISLGVSDQSEEIVVRIVDSEGFEGWGEGSPSTHILGETQGTMLAASERIASRLIGLDSSMLSGLLDEVDGAIFGNTAAKAAFDIALYDLYSKKLGLPLFKFLGGFRDRIETDFTIGIMPINDAVKKAIELINKGFKIIKIKVGLDLNDDIERVKSIRDAVGDSVKLFVDANQAWSPKQAIKAINQLRRFDLELVEQPVKAHDISGLAFVRRNVDVPIMADESVHSPYDAINVIKSEAADLINIKLMKSGGIRNALKITSISEAAGVKNIVGCMMEGAISIAAAVHFAASARNVIFTDLDSDISLKNTLVRSGMVEYKDGFRILSNYPGLGKLEIAMDELRHVKTFTEKHAERSF
ncbi:MAG: dipeptide epimerase [Thermoprotei archaeon]|jgi:o-succinylbenzoate synthase